MKSRENILEGLAEQYKEKFADNGYPSEFKAQGSLCQCNFGGLLLILSNAGDSAIVWCDWADTAVDESLTECEIEFVDDEDEEDSDTVPAVKYGDTYYKLCDFVRIN